MSKRNYSRLARVEEKKNIRAAVFFGIGSIIIIAFFLFLGLPSLAKFAGFLSELRNSGQTIEKSDIIPPAPPEIDEPKEFTNHQNLEISGTAEASSIVRVYSGNQVSEVISGRDGRFNVNISLENGNNIIFAKATDTAGNESQESKRYTVNLDQDPPKLLVITPQDGEFFSGNPEIEIKGNTETGARILLNESQTEVKDDGSFKYKFRLSEGLNIINIKSEDDAGNTTEQQISVTFAP